MDNIKKIKKSVEFRERRNYQIRIRTGIKVHDISPV